MAQFLAVGFDDQRSEISEQEAKRAARLTLDGGGSRAAAD